MVKKYINHNVQFHIGGEKANAAIVIGDNVYVGMNVCLICVDHHIGESNQRAGENVYLDIHVERGC